MVFVRYRANACRRSAPAPLGRESRLCLNRRHVDQVCGPLWGKQKAAELKVNSATYNYPPLKSAPLGGQMI